MNLRTSWQPIALSLVLLGLVLSFGQTEAHTTEESHQHLTLATGVDEIQYTDIQGNSGIAVETWVHGNWTSIEGATWIWDEYLEDTPLEGNTVTFVQEFSIPNDAVIVSGEITLSADDLIILFINGSQVPNTTVPHSSTISRDITNLLQPGSNEISAVVTNVNWGATSPYANPGGLIYRADITYHEGPSDPILNVPYFDQEDDRWGGYEYDSASDWAPPRPTTISRWGCAVTSAAMVLRYYGIDELPNCTANIHNTVGCPLLEGLEVNPGNLNAWLHVERGEDPRHDAGYLLGGLVNWKALETLAFNADRPLDFIVVNESDYMGDIDEALTEEIENGRPAILDVGGHFAVATGIYSSESTFYLNDPGSERAPDLRTYEDYSKFIAVKEVGTDLSGLQIAVDVPNELLATDPLGQKVGYDLSANDVVNQIPNAIYYIQEPIIDDGGSGATSGPGLRILEIDKPLTGQYLLEVVGEDGQEYEVFFYGYDRDAKPNVSADSRTINKDQTPQYIINFDPNDRSEFSSRLQVSIDIKPGSEPNCINNNGHGAIPVAILSSSLFDATTIDPTSISLDGRGVRIVGKGNTQAHIDDINEDGFDDMVVQIEDMDGTYNIGDGIAILSGETDKGLGIIGEDNICIVP